MRAHGTNAKYVLEKCRCEECLAAHKEYEKRYWTRRRANGGAPLMVDAKPVRRHLLSMMQGNKGGHNRDSVGPRTMAKASGVSHGSISKLLYGDYSRGTPPSSRLRRQTAEKLMALTKESAMSDEANVLAGDTLCLIRSLIEFGIPRVRIQDSINAARGRCNGCRLLQAGRTNWIKKAVRDAIYRLHWRLWLTNPEFRWACEIEPPEEIVGILDNARGIPTTSYTEGWRYKTLRGAKTEAGRISGNKAQPVVTLHPDGSYRWYPAKEYVPVDELIVARKKTLSSSDSKWIDEQVTP